MDVEEYIVPAVLYRHEQWILCNQIWVQKWEFRKKSNWAPSGPRLCFEWRTLGADSGIVPENALKMHLWFWKRRWSLECCEQGHGVRRWGPCGEGIRHCLLSTYTLSTGSDTDGLVSSRRMRLSNPSK